MRRLKKSLCLAVTVLLMGFLGQCPATGDTYAVMEKKRERRLRVVREYLVPVTKGQPSVAAIPALMSFGGATNWQIVKSSDFEYQQDPDSIRVTSDNLGMRRRYYELTWQAPLTDEIRVKQTLDVELCLFSTLYTRARLPYSEEVLERFAEHLGSDGSEKINTENPELQPICESIQRRTSEAEEAVELVCDWINENIKFVKGERSSDDALDQKQGSCTPMSRLACAILRRMGIPSDVVSGKFINSDGGHSFVEVYFPDAGWVFYDLSNWNRGFKSLDCLMTVGWAYRAGSAGNMRWIDGYFCEETDKQPFRELNRKSSRRLRKEPEGKIVAGVTVKKVHAPGSVRARHVPLSELIMDLGIPPGPSEYDSKQQISESTESQTEIPQNESSGELRTWTSVRGTTIQARYVSASSTRVVLEMESGQKRTISLSALSKADREYVRNMKREQ